MSAFDPLPPLDIYTIPLNVGKVASFGFGLLVDFMMAAGFWWDGQRGLAVALLLLGLFIGGLGVLSAFEDE